MRSVTMKFDPGFRIKFRTAISANGVSTFDNRNRFPQYRGDALRYDGAEYSTSDNDKFRVDHRNSALKY